ncbi:anti-sigma regulatory factor (Ser/Thr protein kinase) [Geodermatophilus bullaregiensis]|uniref:ATP-binding protein n=1 Tax=Geodermatophilus bullaregiensis TaxID=1564160 RepID=UPI00195EB4B9|nr:ATP-binding protein [Geodermatophilus bullaregiensis]MBM7804979.1 anti-sigma regulatory factor (Ser/Thr protein kinase) [Geodermatophilus bullaregiensis]
MLGAGGHVVDAAGEQVGRIVDVVLSPRSHQPTWLTVSWEPGRAVVVPLAAARRLGACVQLPYTAADVRGAPSVDSAAGPPKLRQAEELGGYFDALDGPLIRLNGHRVQRNGQVPGLSHRDAPVKAPIAAAPVASGPGGSVPAENGHRRTTRARAPESLFTSRGLEMRGRDAPSAYPGTDPGPWSPLDTSSYGPPWWRRRQWRWASTESSVRAMRLALRPLLDTTGLPADDLDDLVLAASEAAENAVEHARRSDRPYFDVLTEVGEDWTGILIQDHGRWLAPSGAAGQGRGLYLMGVLADATLRVGARGTTVVLRSRPASG